MDRLERHHLERLASGHDGPPDDERLHATPAERLDDPRIRRFESGRAPVRWPDRDRTPPFSVTIRSNRSNRSRSGGELGSLATRHQDEPAAAGGDPLQRGERGRGDPPVVGDRAVVVADEDRVAHRSSVADAAGGRPLSVPRHRTHAAAGPADAGTVPAWATSTSRRMPTTATWAGIRACWRRRWRTWPASAAASGCSTWAVARARSRPSCSRPAGRVGRCSRRPIGTVRRGGTGATPRRRRASIRRRSTCRSRTTRSTRRLAQLVVHFMTRSGRRPGRDGPGDQTRRRRRGLRLGPRWRARSAQPVLAARPRARSRRRVTSRISPASARATWRSCSPPRASARSRQRPCR